VTTGSVTAGDEGNMFWIDARDNREDLPFDCFCELDLLLCPDLGLCESDFVSGDEDFLENLRERKPAQYNNQTRL
jgi:hypothetical protein